MYFAGIEGGATTSHIVITNEGGEILSRSDGPSTNHWMVGVDECQARIMKMIQDAKQKAGINLDIPLTSVGLSLSGGEKDMDVIIDNLHKKDQHLSESYHIYNDTQGSIFSASNKGGMVMIAGTGTNCRVVNPDGSTYNCGGWGHLLGDEAGAYWISNRAIKYVFDADDNLEHPPADVSTVRKLMLSHYKLSCKEDLLDHLYRKFDKPKLASFCKIIAQAATETGDMLCRHVFSEAGMMIAKHICALEPHINKTLLDSPGGLQVVCVGSVWKSWELLKEGFLSFMNTPEGCGLRELTLVRLTQSSALGAAWLGARDAGHSLTLDYSATVQQLFHYTR